MSLQLHSIQHATGCGKLLNVAETGAYVLDMLHSGSGTGFSGVLHATVLVHMTFCHCTVLWPWMTMLALLQAAAAAAQPEGAQAVLRALGALTGTAAAVFGRMTSELRQSQAEAQSALQPVVFVAAALAREEALWLSLCCQVCCMQAGVSTFARHALSAKPQWASLCLQAWGEQVAKARRKRGGREGGVLLDKGYNDAMAAVREQAAAGLRVRSRVAV